jgi:hypothetical protein
MRTLTFEPLHVHRPPEKGAGPSKLKPWANTKAASLKEYRIVWTINNTKPVKGNLHRTDPVGKPPAKVQYIVAHSDTVDMPTPIPPKPIPKPAEYRNLHSLFSRLGKPMHTLIFEPLHVHRPPENGAGPSNQSFGQTLKPQVWKSTELYGPSTRHNQLKVTYTELTQWENHRGKCILFANSVL